MNRAPGKMVPCLMAGIIPAVIMNLPFLGDMLGILYICCCLPAFVPGIFGSFLHSSRSGNAGTSFGASHGALIGLLSGLVYWFTETFLAIFKKLVGLGPSAEDLADARDQMHEVLQGLIDQNVITQSDADAAMDWLVGGQPGGMVLGAAVFLMLIVVCSTIGGTIVGIIKRQDPVG